jgi:hypothetical protein
MLSEKYRGCLNQHIQPLRVHVAMLQRKTIVDHISISTQNNLKKIVEV